MPIRVFRWSFRFLRLGAQRWAHRAADGAHNVTPGRPRFKAAPMDRLSRGVSLWEGCREGGVVRRGGWAGHRPRKTSRFCGGVAAGVVVPLWFLKNCSPSSFQDSPYVRYRAVKLPVGTLNRCSARWKPERPCRFESGPSIGWVLRAPGQPS